MIRTVYKRKGRKYSVVTTVRRPGDVSKIFRLISRGLGIATGSINEVSRGRISYIFAQVLNVAGVWDCADFPPGRLDLAKQWMYKAMRSSSPQLSLFGDGI